MSLAARPPSEDDRQRLLDWRNDERVRSMSVDSSPIDQAKHDAWFDRLLAQRSDEFLVVSWADEPVGVVQLEAMERDQLRCSWGCHLGSTAVPPGLGATLPIIGLGFGFDGHGMRRMYAQVLTSNRNMLGMHRRLKIPQEGQLRDHELRPDGQTVSVNLYGVQRHEWAEIRQQATALLPSAIGSSLNNLLDSFVPRAV